MQIPTEIVAAIITIFGGGVCTAIGFVFVAISRLTERMARIEEHFGIETLKHQKK